MLPGKTATKNAATTQPTATRRLAGEDQCGAEHQFDDAGYHHDQIRSEREPGGHLRCEVRPREGQVRRAREQQERAEYHAGDGPYRRGAGRGRHAAHNSRDVQDSDKVRVLSSAVPRIVEPAGVGTHPHGCPPPGRETAGTRRQVAARPTKETAMAPGTARTTDSA